MKTCFDEQRIRLSKYTGAVTKLSATVLSVASLLRIAKSLKLQKSIAKITHQEEATKHSENG